MADASGTMPVGTVLPFALPLGSIPAGWQIADGTNGTRDLRDRFVVGAGGGYAVGMTGAGGGSGAVPNHTHVVTGTTLGERAYTISGYHKHDGTVFLDLATPGAGTAGGGAVAIDGDLAVPHSHAWTVSTSTENARHDHAIAGVTGPAEATASASGLPPFWALYYIQRMS